MYRRHGWIPVFTLALLAVGGCDPDARADRDSVAEQLIDGFEVLVTTESGAIGLASAVAVGTDGRIYVSDRLNHRILIVEPDAREGVSTVGSAGAGPGELQFPGAVAVSDSRIFVHDFGNARVTSFDLDGAYADSWSLPLRASLISSVNARGDLAAPANGHGGLAHLYRSGGLERRDVGKAIVPPSGTTPGSTMASPTSLREQVLRGETPDAFRNYVRPILGEDGTLWLITEADPGLQRYEADGSLTWTQELSSPEIEYTHQQYLEAWANYAPGRGVPEPAPVRAAVASENDLWLLLGEGPESGSVLAVHDARTGELLRRLLLDVPSPAGPFALDRERGYLYVVLAEEASLLRAPLPR